MSNTRGGGRTNSSAAVIQSIPPASRKMVQSLKEIVNCPEAEIYATLKDCNMEPNEAVNRLLTQDPFHEVKSKRDKRKETKDSTESKPRGGSNTSTRGARSGTDRYIGRGGSTQPNSSDPSAFKSKHSYKKENGAHHYSSSSFSAPGVAGNNAYQRPPAVSCMTDENKDLTTSAFDGTASASQPSGYQPVWGSVPGKKSLADIVKMGRPQSKAFGSSHSSHNGSNKPLVHSSVSTELNHGFSYIENQVPKVSDVYTEPSAAPDEWPLIEPSQGASLSPVLESYKDSKLHLDRPNSAYDRIDQHSYSEDYEDEAEEEHVVAENFTVSHVDSAALGTRKTENNFGDASVFDNDMYTNMGSYQSHNHASRNEEDVGASVSSEAENIQQLSIQEKNVETSYQEATPSVIIPNHLQVESADLSHLSFGSFRSGLGASVSGPFVSRSSRGDIEEKRIEADATVIGRTDTGNPEYYRGESSATDGGLVHRTTAGSGSFDSQEASQSEVKQENPELTHGNQYAFPSSSTGYTFENAEQLSAAFNYSQTNSQIQNLATFSSAMHAYPNSLPSSLVAANANPARESELQYSPFPVTQSMPTKYGSGVSSISGSSISTAEVQALKTGFQAAQPTQQSLSGGSVSMAPTLPQHLAVHPYSQTGLPLGPFANMIGYPFLPQSYTYMPSGFQQAFAGNNTYHQSLAAILPQYKNSVSVSSLPQSAAVPSGYGAFGGSSAIPGNYALNPPSAPVGSTVNYEDILSSQYKDNNNLISLQQQNENQAMWLHGSGSGSRTMSAVPASTYYGLQGQNQQPAGFRQGQQQISQNYGGIAYPNFYNSQTGMSMEHQLQNPRDGSLGGSQGQPKQSQQIWQNSY